MSRNLLTVKTLHSKAKTALEEAVREVVERHKKTGRPLAVWKDGKVAWIPAKRLARQKR